MWTPKQFFGWVSPIIDHMPEAPNLRESLDRIVEAHRRGLRDRLQTVENLHKFFRGLSREDQHEFCGHLGQMLQTESLDTTSVRGVGVNIVCVALVALARFGPTEHLLASVFSRLKLDAPKQMEAWAGDVCQNLRYSLFENPDRFSDQCLNQIRNYRATYRLTGQPLPLSLVEALADLDTVLDQLEFERFERTLHRPKEDTHPQEFESVLAALGLGPEIAAAMREAGNYLRTGGEFNPKKAADLLRASMDEAHRRIVTELEKIGSQSYVGRDRDGDRRAYMRRIGFISPAEEKFFSAIYSLISEEASHKLVAPRETVLVLHTTVSNYLFLLLKRLSNLRAESR